MIQGITSNLLLWLFLLSSSTTLIAQGFDGETPYQSDEFVITYNPSATAAERQETRDLYGVTTNYLSLFDGSIEVWNDLTFPIVVEHENATSEIYNIEQLELDINTSNLGDSDPRARISDGDFNYQVGLHDGQPSGVTLSETADPLLYCPADDFRLLGNLGRQRSRFHFVIFDQELSHDELNGNTIEVIEVTENPGGTHANKVTWIIDNLLFQAGSPNVSYTNVAVFDAQGGASYAEILVGFHEIGARGIQDAIVNFSANLTFAARDVSEGNALQRVVSDLLRENNLILVSSAGNDANTYPNVFPGCFDFPNEVTVVGTHRCFGELWPHSNNNNVHYEIAAEATDVVVHDGTHHTLATGTSFAAPLVSAVIAQISSHNEEFNTFALKNTLLQTADINFQLAPYVTNGKILNAYAATTTTGGGDVRSLVHTPNSATTFTDIQPDTPHDKWAVYPNPFESTITISSPKAGERVDAHMELVLRHSSGAIVLQANASAGQAFTVPDHLPAGVYFLHVRQGEDSWQQKLLKQ